jgi:hypothetical protein
MVQRIAFTIRCPRIRAFDWLQERGITIHKNQWQTVCGQERKNDKKGILPADVSYFRGFSVSYSASIGAMVLVEMDLRMSVVSFRQ